jgi:hypothetical protein
MRGAVLAVEEEAWAGAANEVSYGVLQACGCCRLKAAAAKEEDEEDEEAAAAADVALYSWRGNADTGGSTTTSVTLNRKSSTPWENKQAFNSFADCHPVLQKVENGTIFQ